MDRSMTVREPTDGYVAGALARAGIDSSETTRLERESRVAVLLLGNRIAWFPRDVVGLEALEREARVLRLLEEHCRFAVPRVLHADSEGWQIRSMVPGDGAVDMYERARLNPALARRIGESLGRILADQHMNVPPDGLEEWLPALPNWPRAEDLPNLPLVVEDRALLDRIERALGRREAAVRDVPRRVLTHSDLGFHNVAFEPTTLAVAGVYDYEGAAFSDPHLDFKNMSLHCDDGTEPLLEAAAGVYEQVTCVAVDRDRVRLLNATEAIGFLAYRFGHAPEEEWCGRTLAEDLAWADAALKAAGIA
jgi:aminoglycoside phosphotransferase (APT) family kinase protein